MRLAMLAGVTRALVGPKRAYPDPLPGSHDVCFADNPLPAGIEPHFPPRAAAWERRARARQIKRDPVSYTHLTLPTILLV